MNRKAGATAAPPVLADLMADYLRQRATAFASGLAVASPQGEVEPYQSSSGPSLDPTTAWVHAVEALQSSSGSDLRPPSDWPQRVAGVQPVVGLAFCVGHFPQLVGPFHNLLRQNDLRSLRPAQTVEKASSKMPPDADGKTSDDPRKVLLAIGLLRLAGDFEAAADRLRRFESVAPAAWKPAMDNELAAIAWQRGQWDQAVAIWQSASPTPSTLFNRGMSQLFSGRPELACHPLKEAVGLIPEKSGWHHLGRVYLTLAEMKK